MKCDFCETLLPDRVLVCPCGRLVYGKRLAARARDAEELERRGELAAARDAWAETLSFLPEDAMQASEIRARVAKLDGQAPRKTSHEGSAGRAAGVAGGLGALLLGLKAKLGFALALAKSSKILLTGLTMLASIWVYASFMGAPFALLFVVLIWIHEMGHVVALRGYGVRASAPVFIPFMGAVVRLKQQPRNAVEEAWVGLGGPLLGTVGAFAALAAGRALGSELLLAAGHTAIVLNLFNLTPVHPLDGGRAAQALSPPLWVLALAATVGLAWQFSEPLIVLAAFLPLGRILGNARTLAGGGLDAEYHRATLGRRLAPCATYVGLAALLVATFTHFEPELRAIRERHKGGSTADLAWITSASE